MKAVRYDFEAEEELAESVIWYESQRATLGLEFHAEVKATEARLCEHPAAYELKPSAANLGVRHAPVRRFPYSLVFLELESEIRILAVAHVRRKPGYWRERLK